MALPTGTVTLLFSDMEGSTRLLERLGEQYAEALDAQRRVLRDAWARHEGHELGTEGDSFFVAFGRADTAVLAAVEAQRELAAYDWPGDERVSVRIGIHTGVPAVHGDAYVGMDVHRAARIAAAAHGGQILVSEPTAKLVGGLQGVRTLDLGEHALKDISRPEHLFQIGADELRADFPQVRVLGSATNLPSANTALVGREGEVAELTRILAEGDFRLLTLTGPGGTGKTRLAISVAAEVAGETHEVHFVPLETVTTSDLMWTSIATVLGVPPDDRVPPRLLDHIAHAQAILVLDNVEQITEAGDVVGELLDAASGISVLATSRLPLHVHGEREYAVPPLGLPTDDTLEAASQSGAVQLFVRQAALVRRGFELTPDNHGAITAICRRLDALPLAIELAAARTKLLSPSALLDRLDTALDLKTPDGRRPARQQTLRQAIEWSYQLLDPDAQRCLRVLGVFPGGASLDALETVSTALGLDIDPYEQIEALVDASLVVATDTESGEPRFQTLNTIHSFATEKLRGLDEETSAHVAAVTWASQMVDRPDVRSDGAAFEAFRHDLATEYDNLRHLIGWLLDVRGEDVGGLDAEAALVQLIVSIADAATWRISVEISGWLAAAIRASATRADAWTARAVTHLADIHRLAGDSAEAARLLAEARALTERLISTSASDPSARQAEVTVLIARATFLAEAGDTETAREEYATLMSRASQMMPHDLIRMLLQLAGLEAAEGRPSEALALEERALDIAKDHGFHQEEIRAMHNSACSLRELGRVDEAELRMRTNLPLSFALRDPVDDVSTGQDYALILIDLGLWEHAARLLGAVQRTRDQLNLLASRSESIELEEPVARLQGALGDDFSHQLARGRSMSIEEACTRAIAQLESDTARA